MILGIPFDNATSLSKGAAEGPDMMRRLSVDLSDQAEDFQQIYPKLLWDYGDIHIDLNWERYFATVEEEAYKMMCLGKMCLFLGGDHSVTIPLHQAFAKYQRENDRKIGIVHFDAHYDLCKEYDGFKWSHASTEARALEGIVSGEDICFVGIRVREDIEKEVLEAHPGIRTIRAIEIWEKGVKWAIEEIVKQFSGYDAIYFTLDIDVLDPAFAPGTGTPVAGGISSRELITMVREMLARLPIRAMDIVEVAPGLDVNNITSWAALRIIHQLFTQISVEVENS